MYYILLPESVHRVFRKRTERASVTRKKRSWCYNRCANARRSIFGFGLIWLDTVPCERGDGKYLLLEVQRTLRWAGEVKRDKLVFSLDRRRVRGSISFNFFSYSFFGKNKKWNNKFKTRAKIILRFGYYLFNMFLKIIFNRFRRSVNIFFHCEVVSCFFC